MEKDKKRNYSGSDFLNHSWEYSGFLTIIGLSDHGSLWPRKLAQNSNEGHNMSLGQKFLSYKFFDLDHFSDIRSQYLFIQHKGSTFSESPLMVGYCPFGDGAVV